MSLWDVAIWLACQLNVMDDSVYPPRSRSLACFVMIDLLDLLQQAQLFNQGERGRMGGLIG